MVEKLYGQAGPCMYVVLLVHGCFWCVWWAGCAVHGCCVVGVLVLLVCLFKTGSLNLLDHPVNLTTRRVNG